MTQSSPYCGWYSLFIRGEVHVRLGEYDPIQHDVEHHADEHWSIAVLTQSEFNKANTRTGQAYSHFLYERPHFAAANSSR